LKPKDHSVVFFDHKKKGDNISFSFGSLPQGFFCNSSNTQNVNETLLQRKEFEPNYHASGSGHEKS
jgi:hypothetical protein